MARNSLKNVCRLINSVNEQLPVEQLFLADLKRSIELSDAKNSRQPSQKYKPSGMNCMRQMYYQVKGYEPISDPSYCLVGICEAGTDRHERIQNAIDDMKNNGMDCEYIDVAEYVQSRNLDHLEVVEKCGNETKLYYKDLNLSFLCDGIIKYKGHYYITEFKTESIYKWQGRTYVDDSHTWQGTAYATAFGLNDVLFIYINRDNTDMKAYMYNVTDEMKMNFIGRIKACDEYVEDGEVPPKESTTPKKTCAYCDYKKYCESDGE